MSGHRPPMLSSLRLFAYALRPLRLIIQRKERKGSAKKRKGQFLTPSTLYLPPFTLYSPFTIDHSPLHLHS